MQSQLSRTLSLPQMVLYGLGTTIGAGIYALIGELAAVSGYLAPMAFLFAALLAGMTAMSFAEFSGRFPQAAGAALYVKQGFNSDALSTSVGLLVVLAGLVSAAALINGFIGYLTQFVELQPYITVFVLVAIIVGLAAWGIAQSVLIAGLITLIEVGGLILIIGVSTPSLSQLPELSANLTPSLSLESLSLIYAGVLLAFYAFIGFEDMVDVAEEIKNVRRTLPMAILLTLVITAVLYISIMLLALLTFTPEALSQSDAPLALLYEHHTGQSSTIISLIGMFAIINGALIQVIMASRVLYGLSCRGLLPNKLSIVHPKTHTPLHATGLAGLIMLTLALIGDLPTLAEATSIIMLSVYTLVNLALWRVKKHQPAPYGNFSVPRWIPLIGFLVSGALVLFKLLQFIEAS